jgi:hypothetical protein
MCRAGIAMMETQEDVIIIEDTQGEGYEAADEEEEEDKAEWEEEGDEEREEREERTWLGEEDWLEEKWLVEEWQDLDEERHIGTLRLSPEGMLIYREGRWHPV